MFKRDKATAAPETLIGPTVIIRGDIDFSGGLHLEGRITGNLLLREGGDARLDMIAGSEVEGEVRAQHASINGRVRGDVRVAGALVLGPKAVVEGNVHYGTIEMALGARITGKMVPRATQAPGGPAGDPSLKSTPPNPSLQ
jgi:cytoskeletal protein CcmA (bactofilin family)